MELPRTRVEISSISYTASGVAVGNGTYYEPRHIWNVSALCQDEQRDLLLLLYAEHDQRRRILASDPDVLIEDGTLLYGERYPRTRAIVPSTTETLIPALTPTHCLYFAQFKAWFNQEPRITQMDRTWRVDFALQETEKVLAV